jgi:phosphomannomutase
MGGRLSELVQTLPPRFTASDLIRNFPLEKSQQVLRKLQSGESALLDGMWAKGLGKVLGKVQAIDQTDGFRVTFERGDILHFRPSGNAPEFRIYSESESETRAMDINKAAKDWVVELGR